ncbi:MAG: asparagine synthase-related protein [Candidatus Nitrosopumilus sp. bin_6a]
MNIDSIKSILTLRYDYTQIPILPRLNWKDLEKKKDFSLEDISKQLTLNLYKQIPRDYSGPISISLSGGVDSSLALCMLKQSFPNNQIDAISIKFSDSADETETASKIAQEVGVDHHIIQVNNFLEKLPDAISITKLPFWDIHWIYVVENTRNLSNYLVSGDGGDELFSGYVFRYSKFLSKINPNSSPKDKIQAYLSCHERDHVPEQDQIFEKKMQFKWDDICDKLHPFFDNPLSPIEQVFLADYNGKLLYNFSIVNNSIAKHFNINSVTPLLSPEIIQKSIKIPTIQKYDSLSNIGKLPLRKLLKKFGIEDLIEKQKLGFSVNTENLWKNYGFEMAKEYLSDGKIIQDGWIKNDWVQSNLDNQNIDIRHINKLLGLLSFEIWYRDIELQN